MATMPKDVPSPSTEDARRIARKLHTNWGHASAHQLKRTLSDAEGAQQRLLDCVDEVVAQCEGF